MDLQLNPDETRFKKAITLFIDTNFPLAIRESPSPADLDCWYYAVSKEGWIAPEWDTKVGGPGWSPMKIYLWYSLTTDAHCPLPDYCALQIAGPLLHRYGNNPLHQSEVEKILDQSVIWGSALFPGNKSITVSVLDDGYELDGSLPCYSLRGPADRILVLGDTDDGYSLFIIDAKKNGVQLVPGRFSETISILQLDRIQVSRSALVGHEDMGLEHLIYLLTERQSISTVVSLKSSLYSLRKIVSELDLGEEFAHQVADYEIELEGLEITGLRSLINNRGQNIQAINSRVEKLRRKMNDSVTSALGYYSIPQKSLNPGENEPSVSPGTGLQQTDPFTSCPEGFREDLIARTMLGL